MENTMNVEMLIAAIANTDNAYTPEEVEYACADLYSHLKTRVLRWVAFKYCKGRHDLAEDAFQSAMVKLFAAIRGNKLWRAQSIYSWVMTACRFYVLDWYRSERETGLSHIESVVDDRHYYFDPYCAFRVGEIWNEVDRIIKAAVLNMDQRMVFRMSVMGEMTQEEISRELGMTLNEVKSNLHCARKAIKRWQKKTGYDPYACIAGKDARTGDASGRRQTAVRPGE